jgi:hypothetical protein
MFRRAKILHIDNPEKVERLLPDNYEVWMEPEEELIHSSSEVIIQGRDTSEWDLENVLKMLRDDMLFGEELHPDDEDYLDIYDGEDYM